MDKLTPDGIGGSLMDGANGITQECEEYGDYRPEPVFTDPMQKILYMQDKADHKCPECGKRSASIGVCSRCGATWQPPLFM